MQIFEPSLNTKLEIPFAFCPVKAGFPSPALDYADKKIDLHEHLIKHPAATFYVRAEGDSMIGRGIFSKDILIVDKSLEPKNGDIIVAILNGEFTLKEYQQDKEKKIYLVPANKEYKKIEIKLEDDFKVWGVVITAIHKFL